MSGRRGATLTKALLTVGCLLVAPLAQAISVGNLTFSLPAEADFASKRVVNNNKSARLYRIAVSAIDRPGGSEVRSRPVDGELLFAPVSWRCRPGERILQILLSWPAGQSRALLSGLVSRNPHPQPDEARPDRRRGQHGAGGGDGYHSGGAPARGAV